jgi:hypothetical protein
MKHTDNTRLVKVKSRIFESIGTPEKLKAEIGATGIFYDYFIFGKLANRNHSLSPRKDTEEKQIKS